MEKQSRVTCISPPFHDFVRVSLENGSSFQISVTEAQCRDIRVGDAITYSPDTHTPCVIPEMRPPETVPFTC